MTENGIIYLNEVDSTNNYLKHIADDESSEAQEGLMVCAEFQSKGRGYSTNTWESKRGENLTFSILFYPVFLQPSEMFLISQFVSLGIIDFLSNYIDRKFLSIKWPNDIYWKDKKICGILIENLLSSQRIEYSIIGIGLNVNQTKFESSAPNPVSISQITGKKYSVNEAAIKIKQTIFARYLSLLKGGFKQIQLDYVNSLYRRDGFYKYNDGKEIFKAKIVGLRDNGGLTLQREDGVEKEYMFKEIEYVI